MVRRDVVSCGKYVYQVQSSVTCDSVPDPADLDLEQGYSEPELCFSRSQVRDPAYALLDSGATHVLLPGHMLPKASSILRSDCQSGSWQRESTMLALMKSMQKTEHIRFYL